MPGITDKKAGRKEPIPSPGIRRDQGRYGACAYILASDLPLLSLAHTQQTLYKGSFSLMVLPLALVPQSLASAGSPWQCAHHPLLPAQIWWAGFFTWGWFARPRWEGVGGGAWSMSLVTPDPQVSRNWGAASTSAVGLWAQHWGRRRRWPQGLQSALQHPVTARLFWEASLDSFVVGALCSQKGPGMTWEGLHPFTPRLFLCPEARQEETSLWEWECGSNREGAFFH